MNIKSNDLHLKFMLPVCDVKAAGCNIPSYPLAISIFNVNNSRLDDRGHLYSMPLVPPDIKFTITLTTVHIPNNLELLF